MPGDEDLPLVLLDTNALFMPFQLGLDLEGEIERVLGRCRVAVPRVALAELGAMADSVRDGRAALQLARRFEVVETTGLGDDAVVDAALVTGAVDPEQYRRVSWWILAAALAVGWAASYSTLWFLSIFGLTYFVYSAPPLRL